MALSVAPRDVDITNRSHLEELVTEIETSQNITRKREAFKTFEVNEGAQKQYVQKRLAELYPTTHNKFRVADISIVQKISKKLNKAYMQSPIRKLNTDNETEVLNRIYNKFSFDRAYKEADKIFNLHKYVAMWLTYVNPDMEGEETEGKYILQALSPYEYDLIRDDITGEPLIFILSYSGTDVTGGADGVEQTITESQRDTAAETKVYSIWSKNTFVKIRVSSVKEESKPNISFIDLKPNQLGLLPVTFLSKDLAVDYPTPTNIADQSIEWNTSFSDLKTASSTQGHGQLIIEHPESISMQQLHMGMHTAITLPQSKKETDKPTKASYISASPDLMGQLEVLKFDLINILDEQGITSNSAIEGGTNDVKSGFDRLVKNADVGDIITGNQGLYTDSLEQGTFKILMAYENALNTARFTSDELEVHFEKSKVLISDKETLDNIKLREELGLMLAHEKHMVMNPNLSDKQAKAREEEIQKQKEESIQKMQSVLGEDTTNEEDLIPLKEEDK